MSDTRICPECGQLQEWCDSLACSLPPGHWSHMGDDASERCGNLGDRNRDPARPPYNAWQYMPGMRRS